MGEKTALTGNDATAVAFRQVNPDVAAVFPITPQTELMHKFAAFAADGEVDTELVPVESEHSAMSAAIGSAAAGARTITATSSQGLALMWEMLYIAASMRLPIVMVNVNRALSGPINIHCDHSDSMGARDSGWIQIFSESAQEAYDNTVQAFRIAEDKNVLLPVMVTLDGFIISHTMEALQIEPDEAVRGFVGEYKPDHWLLSPDETITLGPLDLPDWYFEHKRQQIEATYCAPEVIERVGAEYGKLTGRPYGLMEKYKCDDADLILVAMGSTAGTAKVTIDKARSDGLKAGLLKVRVFRPFPGSQIAAAIKRAKAVCVLDRSVSFGLAGGPLFNEIRSAAYGAKLQVPIINFIYGLGGRDINDIAIRTAVDAAGEAAATGKTDPVDRFLGLRG